jgi:hypothetical protein
VIYILDHGEVDHHKLVMAGFDPATVSEALRNGESSGLLKANAFEPVGALEKSLMPLRGKRTFCINPELKDAARIALDFPSA